MQVARARETIGDEQCGKRRVAPELQAALGIARQELRDRRRIRAAMRPDAVSQLQLVDYR